ncbi:MAG: glycosyltransferase family 2 protein [Verrucomicrobia bacterium]|nr:glycosyltransferase family 2 protein [Verrucomicrobiota bacterium]
MQKNKAAVLISAVVVTFNEERHLSECLHNIKFCDEIIVVDLGSTDRSLEIARLSGANIISHEWVPEISYIRKYLIGLTKNEWVLLIDPDEIFNENIVQCIMENKAKIDSSSIICIPTQFYFLGEKLTTTTWGQQELRKQFLFNKNRSIQGDDVHQNADSNQGYQIWDMVLPEMYKIKHFWIDTIRQLFEKHDRYIKLEGKARYNKGIRFSYILLFVHTSRDLSYNLFALRGLTGGWRGVFLSFFHAWYEMCSLLSLKKYERSLVQK